QELNEEHDGKLVTMAGVVTNVRPHQTKKGDPMGFVSVEDLQGHLELVVFPRAWKEISSWVAVEQIVLIKGKVDAKGSGSAKILVDSLSREFKVTKPLTPARPTLRGDPDPFEQVKVDEPRPTTRPTVEEKNEPDRFEWATFGDQRIPAPWLDDELPLPMDEPELSDDLGPVAVDLPTSTVSLSPGEPQPVETLQASAVPAGVSATAVKVESNSGNGNGNGKRLVPAPELPTPVKPKENVHMLREAPVAVYQPASTPSEPRCIVVTIKSSGDKKHDARKMRRIHGLLTSYPDEDRFEFRIYEHDQRKYQLRFPN